jgi:DNA processing protein
LITADFALEQGREVFALPGKVDSLTSFGANGLIKQGAKLVSCVEDITEEFSPTPDPPKKQGIDEHEGLILANIAEESVQLDELVEKTNLEIPEISDILLRLQMKHLVRQLPGKQFVRL